MRRSRPLLGTFVEISASGLAETKLHRAINAAFIAIENIQWRMSAHDPTSELSRVNREAIAHPVTVSSQLFSVLELASKIASISNGGFDYTIAPILAAWGFLPSSLRRKDPGDWRDVILLPERKVHFLRALALDLGGIAKGFAVDSAITVLRGHGATAAVVNAGGDLRAFGPEPISVHLRNPAAPRQLAYRLDVSEAALATSSPCFTERRWHGQRISHLFNPLKHVAITGTISISVRAPECWLADALTKVALNAPEIAESVLKVHQAEAFVLTA